MRTDGWIYDAYSESNQITQTILGKTTSNLPDADDVQSISSRQLMKPKGFTVEALEMLRSDNVPVGQLVASKILHLSMELYRALFPT